MSTSGWAHGHLLGHRSLRFPRVHVNEPACTKHEQTCPGGKQHGAIGSNSNKTGSASTSMLPENRKRE